MVKPLSRPDDVPPEGMLPFEEAFEVSGEFKTLLPEAYRQEHETLWNCLEYIEDERLRLEDGKAIDGLRQLLYRIEGGETLTPHDTFWARERHGKRLDLTRPVEALIEKYQRYQATESLRALGAREQALAIDSIEPETPLLPLLEERPEDLGALLGELREYQLSKNAVIDKDYEREVELQGQGVEQYIIPKHAPAKDPEEEDRKAYIQSLISAPEPAARTEAVDDAYDEIVIVEELTEGIMAIDRCLDDIFVVPPSFDTRPPPERKPLYVLLHDALHNEDRIVGEKGEPIPYNAVHDDDLLVDIIIEDDKPMKDDDPMTPAYAPGDGIDAPPEPDEVTDHWDDIADTAYDVQLDLLARSMAMLRRQAYGLRGVQKDDDTIYLDVMRDIINSEHFDLFYHQPEARAAIYREEQERLHRTKADAEFDLLLERLELDQGATLIGSYMPDVPQAPRYL